MDKIKITCPGCQKTYSMVKPEKEGAYKITCPYCQAKASVRFVDSKAAPSSPAPTDVVARKCISCGVTLKFKSSLQGAFKVTCPKCHTEQVIKLGNGTEPSQTKRDTKENVPVKTRVANRKTLSSAAQLIQLRRFRSNITHTLKEGENLIGRADLQQVSDITIDSDDSISRRSAVIEVLKSDGRYLFKFKVLKASNPVYHNNKPLTVGESVYLNYGDKIVLGKTHFLFDKL